MAHYLFAFMLYIQFLSAFDAEPAGVLKDNQFVGKWWNPLPSEIVKRIVGKSWKPDCPVPLEDLAYVQVTHWNFNHETVNGELLYHKNLALEIVEIFKDLFEADFPIEKMVLIDNYDANDDLSMEDNNSSAFCFRAMTGKLSVYSMHSYGGTIDLNPKQNPYVKGNIILPKGSEVFCDRTLNTPGLIKEDDCCYQAFIKRGYTWGGHWSSLKDYQHFEKRPKVFIP